MLLRLHEPDNKSVPALNRTRCVPFDPHLLAAHFLECHFGLSPSVARTVAELAQLGGRQ